MSFTLRRTLHLTNPYMRGEDCRQLQNLLNDKGFPCIEDGIFGPQTAQACVKAKTFLKFPADQIQPTAGELLVSKLQSYKGPAPVHTTTIRDKYVEVLNYILAHPQNWRYAEVRPIPMYYPYKTTEIITTDCSGSVTMAAKWAGATDPNGNHFNGNGYTGTILQHCETISRAMLEPGDLCVFKPYPGVHVGAFLGDDRIFSHGHPGDPNDYSLNGMISEFGGYVTYKRFIYN